MEIMITKPVMLKYLGLELYFHQEDFDMLQRFRERASQDWRNCSCRVDADNKSYRCSFFGKQQPTDLKEGGELDPTEISHHLPEHIRIKIKDLLNNPDPFSYENWRSENNKKIIRHYLVP